MVITQNSAVAFDYTLTNDAGEVIDSSRDSSPLYYLHGHRNIISGLEKELLGKKTGDSFSVRISPEEGYGNIIEQLRQEVPRQSFQGVDHLEVGMRFQADTDQGPIAVRIVALNDDTVTVDGNHPLAGQHLNFAIDVVEVRDATPEELAHGHVHGAGGCGH